MTAPEKTTMGLLHEQKNYISEVLFPTNSIALAVTSIFSTLL